MRLVLGLLLGLAGFTGAAHAQTTEAVQEYVLGAGDVVEVKVLGRDDFRTQTRVRPDGTILLPFLGAFPAADKSPTELGSTVTAALRAGGFFADPVVSVDVVSYASRYLTVLGLVGAPGLVPVDRAYRLSEILARVGGAREGAADYVVLRPAGGTEQRYPIEVLALGDAAQDPLVSPGDKIYVPKAEVFYIYGEVNSPGAYPVMSEPTLRKALARGGGLKPTGTHSRIKVYRRGERIADVGLTNPVEPGDVILVGERLF